MSSFLSAPTRRHNTVLSLGPYRLAPGLDGDRQPAEHALFLHHDTRVATIELYSLITHSIDSACSERTGPMSLLASSHLTSRGTKCPIRGNDGHAAFLLLWRRFHVGGYFVVDASAHIQQPQNGDDDHRLSIAAHVLPPARTERHSLVILLLDWTLARSVGGQSLGTGSQVKRTGH